MKKALARALVFLLLLASLGLLYLTNTGILSLDKPYIYRYSAEISTAAKVTAFVNINVIPMDGERILPAQTVLVRTGVIEKIASTRQVKIPHDVLIVDGTGKYLMPGLVDMHVHVMNANDLLLFVANGVTTVRNMWGMTGASLAFGFPDQLSLRNTILARDLFGPTIYTAGPVVEGEPKSHPLMVALTSPAEAQESAAWQATQGYDFIKVYDHLDAEVYRAILKTAKEQGTPVVGHVPFAVGIDDVLSGGQLTIEHLTGYIDPDAARFLVPEDQLDIYATRTHEAVVWNVPTLSLYPKNGVSSERLEELDRQPGLQYLSPGRRVLNAFLYSQMSQGHTYTGEDYPERITALNLAMTRALQKAGAGILLGTDALNPYQLPGYSAHEEMGYLVQAGLSPYKALRAGTRDPALVLGHLEDFGTIAEGKRADLLLLDANPLDNVANASKISGVMVRGRWLPQNELQSMLDGLEDSFEPTLLERLWPLALVVLTIAALQQGGIVCH